MRFTYMSAALLWILVLAAPAGAQKPSEMPTELWSEYPLVQKVERPQSTAESAGEPSAIGPLLPPADPEAAPAPGESTRWGLWLALLGLGAIAVIFAARAAPPVAASGIRVVGGGAKRARARVHQPRVRTRKPKPVRLRDPEHFPRARARGRQAQYAPLPPVALAEPDIEREPRRSVVRRTGLLRSRFVVVADEPEGRVERLGSSKSFWRVGGATRRERAAEDAWIDLVNDLRLTGWEPDLARRSDFYVLLRQADVGPSSILPTIEAYTHADEYSDGS